MSYFEYTREDYKNLYVPLSMVCEEETATINDLMLCRGILKTVSDTLKADWRGVLEDYEDKGLLDDTVHYFIIEFLDRHISSLQKLICQTKDEYWRSEFDSWIEMLKIARRGLAVKAPLSF